MKFLSSIDLGGQRIRGTPRTGKFHGDRVLLQATELTYIWSEKLVHENWIHKGAPESIENTYYGMYQESKNRKTVYIDIWRSAI